ncbi:hypothetical protein PFISCL1PPCAC_18866, partial [Pristionchus fissidentatus]
QLDELVYRMKVLYMLQISQNWRETLAAGLADLASKLWEERRRVSLRALYWVISTVWKELPTELNSNVRVSLLRIGLWFMKFFFYLYKKSSNDASVDSVVQVLEQVSTR